MSQRYSIAQLLDWAFAYLEGGESPKLDARLLLAFCLDKNQTYLMTWPDKEVESRVVKRFKELVELRLEGHPIAHLLGYRDFWTLRLNVSPATLIPRPETELLIDKALELEMPTNAKVLDLGTGTGAIGLALAKECPEWQVHGVDVVPEAVQLANQNAIQNGLSRVCFYQSSWFSNVSQQDFDLIITNPPYVEQQSPWLSEGDVRFEPASALTAGADGLDDIREIVAQARNYIKSGGWLMIEHGFSQAMAVHNLLRAQGFSGIVLYSDLNGLARVTAAQR